MEDERPRLWRSRLGGLDCCDEERVIAGRVLLGEAAAEPGHGAFQLRRPLGLVAERDAFPEGDGGDAASEVLGKVLLAGREDAGGELLSLAEQLVQRGVAAVETAEPGPPDARPLVFHGQAYAAL